MKKLLRLISLLLLSTALVSAVVVWFIFGSGAIIINSGLTYQKPILDNSQQFILYSLDPSSLYKSLDPADNRKAELNMKGKEIFHGCVVLGKTNITDLKVKDRLISALYSGVKNGNGGALCFDPHHGIRAVSGNRKLDLVICFECDRINVYTDLLSGQVYTSGSPATVFDKVLTDAKIPLGERPNTN